PSSQQVPKPVVSVRRRLDFSQIFDPDFASPDDSSDESIDNPFASDSSSSESEEHEKKFAELSCLCALPPQKECLHGPMILNV
ncbi:hypothetical protein RRG08_057722, partial [Elysia crispata]